MGVYAALSHIPNLRKTNQAEVVAICRRNPERLALAKQELSIDQAFTDWREMLDKVALDAVVVCTPHNAHTEPTIAALERGLHVLVEKPLALTSKDAWAMVNAAEKAKRVLMVGYNSRTDGLLRTVKRVVGAGTIGAVRQINTVNASDARMFYDTDPSLRTPYKAQFETPGLLGTYLADYVAEGNWHTDPAVMGGGMFADRGSHVVDQTLWLAGERPIEVMALIEAATWPIDNYLTAQARLTNGVLFSVTFTAEVSGGEVLFYSRQRVTILGARGLITIDSGHEGTKAWVETDGVGKNLAPEFEDTTISAAFLDTILAGAPNLAPAREAAQAVALIEAVYRSAKDGRPVQIERAPGA